MKIAKRVIRTLGTSVILLLAVITALFILLEIAPGDPVTAIAGNVPITEEYRQTIIATYGLDQSFWHRYFVYMTNILTGNFGNMIGSQEPILGAILGRAFNTLIIAIPAFIISTLGGLVLGTVAANTRLKSLDGVLSGGAVALFSIPNFWLGLMLIMLFSVTLGWLPSQGTGDLRSGGIDLRYMILPVITMAMTELAYKTRIMRSSVLETLGQDFMDTARSKGLSRRQSLWKHALPNSLLPMVTVTGYSLGYILAGSALVEKVFSWPGIGLFLVDSISRQDNQAVIGVVIVITVAVLIINILTDLVYGLVDPRLRMRIGRTGETK